MSPKGRLKSDFGALNMRERGHAKARRPVLFVIQALLHDLLMRLAHSIVPETTVAYWDGTCRERGLGV